MLSPLIAVQISSHNLLIMHINYYHSDEGGSETPGATPLGAIIGGTIGGAVLLIILVISVISITIVCVKKRRDSRASVGQPRVVPPAYPKRYGDCSYNLALSPGSFV